jgi:hypothetical protein
MQNTFLSNTFHIKSASNPMLNFLYVHALIVIGKEKKFTNSPSSKSDAKKRLITMKDKIVQYIKINIY